MNELNLKLHGKDNLACDLDRIIKRFRGMLSLFESQLEESFSHSISFKEICATITKEIILEFQKRIFVT